MAEVVIQATVRIMVDADKQYVGGKNWEEIFDGVRVYTESIGVKVNDVEAESVQTSSIHVHDGSNQCSTCSQQSKDGVS